MPMRNLGPFYKIDDEAYGALRAKWAKGREVREAGGPAFARDVHGVLKALGEGRQPEPVRGINVMEVVGLLASGKIAARAADDPAGPRPPSRGPRGEEEGARDGRPSQALVQRCASDPGLWPEFLKTMAEHPGMSAPNLASITHYRIERGLADTADLLSRRQVEALGGRVCDGVRGAVVNRRLRVQGEDGAWHDGGRFFREALYPASDCEGLDPARVPGVAEKADPSDTASMDRFVRATGKVDLDRLDPIASYAFSLRYGMADPRDAVPPAPAAESAAELIAALRDVSTRLGRVCAQVDRALRETGPEIAPEPARRPPLDNMTQAGIMESLAAVDRSRASAPAAAGPWSHAN